MRRQEALLTLGALTAYLMHQVLKYLVTVEAARQLGDDRRTGTIEPLLVTPISEADIVAGQKRALISLFLWPGLVLLAVNLVLFYLSLWLGVHAAGLEFAPLCFVSAISGAAMLFFDFHALSLVGMWLVVKGAGHQRAVFGTLARVMLGPWLAVACLVLIRGLGHNVAFESIICWLGVSVLIDLALANWAKDELMRGLRDHPPESAAPEATPEAGLRTEALTLP
jgi:hypothetical protein